MGVKLVVVRSHYKLPANYVFHIFRPRDGNDIKLKDCYKSSLQNVLIYNVMFIAFCCVVYVIPGFGKKEAAEVAVATVRLWLESNHSSVDHVIFCTYENVDYEIYKDLMSIVFFPMSKILLTNNYMKENSDKDCVVNVKNVEISDALGQNLSAIMQNMLGIY